MYNVIRLKSVSLGLLLLSMSKATYAMMPVIDVAALAQLGNQLTQLKIQTQTLQQTLQTLSGDQYQWSQTHDLMHQLNGVMQKSQGMTYTSATLEKQFQKAYPGYQSPDNFANQYQQNVNTTQHTFQGVLQSCGMSTRHFEEENHRLAFLQRQAQSAQGQTQVLQASSQIASEMVSQQQLLRQAVMAQSNAQTAYYANQVQQDASSRAELEKVIHGGSTHIPAYGAGQGLVSPNF